MSLTSGDIQAIQQALQPSFDKIESRLDQIDKRIDKLEIEIDIKFAALEKCLNQRITQEINALRQEVKGWFQTLAAHIDQDVMPYLDRINEHDQRLTKLEQQIQIPRAKF